MTSSHSGIEPHSGSVTSATNTLRAGVLGANDGIVSVAALLIGVLGAGASDSALMTAGIAATVGGAVSMALGEYVSVSSQRDTERVLIDKERRELVEDPDGEHEELTQILAGYGMSEQTARTAASEITQGDALGAHLRLELGIDQEELTSPIAAAASSAIAFVLGAIVPLAAALLAPSAVAAVVVALVTLLALGLTGYISARLSDAPRGRAIARLVIGGALGLAVTYGIGALFAVQA
ncbi:VIT1/CCC1 transporter family protein [Corynebacterium tapiri]|uniref:VIT family protein n=1 Tax=Corynebacterium tapiri TaxID=1448266 RepID=A0A5C4U5V8_9CORY|nr:VIT family protein [Corynebacterium tapiri]TNL98723.1 VIT family protein [Corynebacterium tapiri]